MMVKHCIFQPGDGTCYDIVCVDDPYGGVLVIWPGQSTWRYHEGDRLKFLHGKLNKWTKEAIWNYLEERRMEVDAILAEPEIDECICKEDENNLFCTSCF